MQERIEFVETEGNPVLLENADIYQVRRDRPLVWLQQVACWVLRKIGAHHHYTEIQYTRRVVQPQKVMENLFRQRAHIQEQFNREPRQLLIGAEDYQELMDEAGPMPGMISFDAQYRRGSASRPKICGLKITVVPWMKGVLVMPNESES